MLKENDIRALSINDLRQYWSELWQQACHKGIGRKMLERSIMFKLQEREGNSLTHDQQARLDQLTKQYKRNPRCFDEDCVALKPGTRLIRNWKGKRHSVLVKSSGFDYQDQHYTSLSQVANDITGSRWNGRVFFGLNKKKVAS